MRNKPFQSKRDKMYTMSAFDPALIMLVNIYADQYNDRQETSVYNNGVMQVSVFLSVYYIGEGASENEIIEYVQNNAEIYSLDYAENIQWSKSTTDNGFSHDIYFAGYGRNASVPPKSSEIRVPLYFTVPGGAARDSYRWIGKMDGQRTDIAYPLNVIVESFEVSALDFEIVERAKFDSLVMRVLKYTREYVYPSDVHKIRNLVDYSGFKFIGTGGNTWVSMLSRKRDKMGVFVEYRVTKNIHIDVYYTEYARDEVVIKNYPNHECHGKILTTGITLTDTSKLDPTVVDNAWNEGLVMIQIGPSHSSTAIQCMVPGYGWKMQNFALDHYVLQDTCGGRVEVSINWNVDGYFGVWEVTEAKVVYP